MLPLAIKNRTNKIEELLKSNRTPTAMELNRMQSTMSMNDSIVETFNHPMFQNWNTLLFKAFNHLQKKIENVDEHLEELYINDKKDEDIWAKMREEQRIKREIKQNMLLEKMVLQNEQIHQQLLELEDVSDSSGGVGSTLATGGIMAVIGAKLFAAKALVLPAIGGALATAFGKYLYDNPKLLSKAWEWAGLPADLKEGKDMLKQFWDSAGMPMDKDDVYGMFKQFWDSAGLPMNKEDFYGMLNETIFRPFINNFFTQTTDDGGDGIIAGGTKSLSGDRPYWDQEPIVLQEDEHGAINILEHFGRPVIIPNQTQNQEQEVVNAIQQSPSLNEMAAPDSRLIETYQKGRGVIDKSGTTDYKCALGVRKMFHGAGIAPDTAMGNAYRYSSHLAAAGAEQVMAFQHSDLSNEEIKKKILNLPPGYIVTWNPTNREKDPHGHVSLTIGEGHEYSDRKASLANSYRNAVEKKRDIRVFSTANVDNIKPVAHNPNILPPITSQQPTTTAIAQAQPKSTKQDTKQINMNNEYPDVLSARTMQLFHNLNQLY